MALPRRFWILTGWVIALTTLAAAFGTVRDAYVDLQSLEQCGSQESLSRTLVCSRYRLVEGAAQVAVLVARIPAIGLAFIAAALWYGNRHAIGSNASGPATNQSPANAGQAAHGAGTAPTAKVVARARAQKRTKRQSKGSTTTLDAARSG